MVAAEDLLVEIGGFRALEVGEPDGGLVVVAEGLEDFLWVAMDVDEFRIGKHLENNGDAGGVRGGLEEKGLVVFVGEFFEEFSEGVFPGGSFCRGGGFEGEKAVVFGFVAWEGDAEIG